MGYRPSRKPRCGGAVARSCLGAGKPAAELPCLACPSARIRGPPGQAGGDSAHTHARPRARPLAAAQASARGQPELVAKAARGRFIRR
jgi:hypothetical protein